MTILSRCSLLALALAGLCLSTTSADEASVKALQGTWSTDIGIPAEFAFQGNKLEANISGKTYKGEVQADASAKPHATLDITLEKDDADTKPVSKSIFKVNGETLTICVGLPGKDRPASFETGEDCFNFELKLKKEEASADEAVKALAGTWANDGGDGIQAEWKFEGDKLEANINGNTYKAEIKLDAKATPHSTMDVIITESPDGDGKGKVGKAIYKLDGDKLSLCVALPGNDRPTEFSNVDEVQYKFELKKQ